MVGGFLTNQACIFCGCCKTCGTNPTLDIDISLWWQGYSGLQSQKRQKIKTLEEVDLGPDFICFYRGNNLGKLSAKKVKIVADDMLEFIRSRFPNSMVIWSYIFAILHHAPWKKPANLLIPT